ncbi:hypothetical protein ACHAXS_011089 [Conticribra weissflogii]
MYGDVQYNVRYHPPTKYCEVYRISIIYKSHTKIISMVAVTLKNTASTNHPHH